MIDRVRQLRDRLRNGPEATSDSEPFAHLRAATAQLLVATAAGATLEHTAVARQRARSLSPRTVPAPLMWAPALIGPLAAAAHLEHTRRPSERTTAAVRILDAASVGFGGALFLYDFLVTSEQRATRLGPLAFASAGVLGMMLERHEKAIRGTERDLRRRGEIVERLVPRRRERLDRVVIHV